MSLKKAIQIKLRDKSSIRLHADSNDIIVKKVAYNTALDYILDFIDRFEAGEIVEGYLESLDVEQEKARKRYK